MPIASRGSSARLPAIDWPGVTVSRLVPSRRSWSISPAWLALLMPRRLLLRGRRPLDPDVVVAGRRVGCVHAVLTQAPGVLHDLVVLVGGGGAGLGLSIVAAIAQAHDAGVTARPTPAAAWN
jgi:hypothetical protein